MICLDFFVASDRCQSADFAVTWQRGVVSQGQRLGNQASFSPQRVRAGSVWGSQSHHFNRYRFAKENVKFRAHFDDKSISGKPRVNVYLKKARYFFI
jgi:hypothetical protein